MTVSSSEAASSQTSTWQIPQISLQEFHSQMNSGFFNFYVSTQGDVHLGCRNISEVINLNCSERKVIEDQIRRNAGQKIIIPVMSDRLPQLSHLKSLVIEDDAALDATISSLREKYLKPPQERYRIFFETIGKPKSPLLSNWEKKALYWIEIERKFAEYSRAENEVGIKAMMLQRELLSVPGIAKLGPRIIWNLRSNESFGSELFALLVRFPQMMKLEAEEFELDEIFNNMRSGLKSEDAQSYLSFIHTRKKHQRVQKQYEKLLDDIGSAFAGINRIWPERLEDQKAMETVIPGFSLLLGMRLSLIDNAIRQSELGETCQDTNIAPYYRIQRIQKSLDASEKAQVAYFNFILKKFPSLLHTQMLNSHVNIQKIIKNAKPVLMSNSQILQIPPKHKTQAKKRVAAPQKKSPQKHQTTPIVISQDGTFRAQSSKAKVKSALIVNAGSSTSNGSPFNQTKELSSASIRMVNPKPVSVGTIFESYIPRLHERVSLWKSVRPNQKLPFEEYRAQNLDSDHQEKIRFWHSFPWLADHLIRNPLYTQRVERGDGGYSYYGIAEIRYADRSTERGYVEWCLSKSSVLYHRFFNKQTDQELLKLAAERVFTTSFGGLEEGIAMDDMIEPKNGKFLFDPVIESYTFVEEETQHSMTFYRMN